jgi:tryptophan synthase alpha chain
LRDAGLALVPLVAPTTPPERRKRICSQAQGFIYLVSDTRTTGERDTLPESLGELIQATQADSPVPVAVGFGIGTPEQAAQVGAVADGVIVGTRLVRAVQEAPDAAAAAAAVSEFIDAARAAMTSEISKLPSR